MDQPLGDALALVLDAIETDKLDDDACARLRVTLAKRLAHQRQGTTVRRTGIVTGWRGTAGFITDGDGESWFVSASSLPDGIGELEGGTAVTFSGKGSPRPGKKYPEAFTVRPAEKEIAL